MDKIIRRQFLGSWVPFLGLCISVIGIPIAILYYKQCMLIVEEGLENPSAFLEAYRAGRRGGSCEAVIKQNSTQASSRCRIFGAENASI